MLSRWYAIFLGIILLILGIAGLMAPRLVTGVPVTEQTLVWSSVVWLITAVVALWFGFGVRSVSALRWFAGIVGSLYLLWGIISMITAGRVAPDVALTSLLGTMAGLMILLGSLGLAAALAPAYWLREHETYAPGNA